MHRSAFIVTALYDSLCVLNARLHFHSHPPSLSSRFQVPWSELHAYATRAKQESLRGSQTKRFPPATNPVRLVPQTTSVPAAAPDQLIRMRSWPRSPALSVITNEISTFSINSLGTFAFIPLLLVAVDLYIIILKHKCQALGLGI